MLNIYIVIPIKKFNYGQLQPLDSYPMVESLQCIQYILGMYKGIFY